VFRFPGIEVDSAKEVMAWDRIGFVVIEGFFCFLVVLPGLVSHLRRAGFADWMPMHPWMDQDGVFKTHTAWCIVC